MHKTSMITHHVHASYTSIIQELYTNKVSLQSVHKTTSVQRNAIYSYKQTQDCGIRNPFSIKQSHMTTQT